MRVVTRTRLLTILCMLLFAVTAMGVGAAFAVEGGQSSGALTVEAIGWGGSASEAAAKGCADVNESDRVEFQIWFSDAIHSENAVNLVNTDAGLGMDVVKSALQFIEINGKTLGAIVGEITAISGGTTVGDGLLGMHIQGDAKNFQFNFKKSIQSVAEGKYAALPDCYLNVEKDSPYKLTDDNTITVKAGFTAMGKTVAEDVTFVYNPPVDGSHGRWAEDKAKELNVTSIESYMSGGTEIVIKISVDAPLVNESIVHAARDNEGTVVLMNSQEKLDLIKANGLRYSLWNKIAINGETIYRMIQKNFDYDSNDPDGELDIHMRGGADGDKIEIRIKTASASAVELKDGLTVTVLEGFRSDLGKFSESVSYVFNEAEGLWTKGGSTIVREALSVESITSKDDEGENEIAITVTFGSPVNKETVNHMARENEGTVALVNGQAKLDNIKANGLRDSVLNKLTVGGKTIYELIQLNKNTPGVEDYDGKLDVHVKAGDDGNKMEIHIKKGVDGSVALEDGLQIKFLKGFQSDLVTVTEDIVYTYINGSWYAAGEEPPVQKETGIVNIYQTIDASDIQIYVIFDGSLNNTGVNHIARENFGTVVAVNGQEKADHINTNGLRDSIRENIAINGKTLKELMALGEADPKDSDASAAVDVHIEGETYNTIKSIILNDEILDEISKIKSNELDIQCVRCLVTWQSLKKIDECHRILKERELL